MGRKVTRTSCAATAKWVCHAGLPVVVILLGYAARLHADESYDLAPLPSRGDTRHVRIHLSVNGSLKLNPDGKAVKHLPLAVAGDLSYDERLLAHDQPLCAVRHYHTATAHIEVGSGKRQQQLNDDHRLIGIYMDNGGPVLLSPNNPLSREELDLLDVPGNSAFVAELLPDAGKKVGEQWRPSEKALSALLNLEAIRQAEVTSRLVEVEADIAVIEMSGTVNGAVGGVSSDIELKARYSFDLVNKHVRELAMAIQEDRSIGHAEPGFEVIAQLRMAIQRVHQPDSLTDDMLSRLPREKPPDAELLRYASSEGGFSLLMDRRWRVMVDAPQVTVLRMIDRGDLVAQCNISKLADLPAGQHLGLEKFQADIRKSLGENFGQFLEASQTTTDDGLHVVRVAAAGVASGLPIHWIYYHLANDSGRRISYVFTMEDKYVERFEGADATLVRSLEFSHELPTDVDQPTPRVSSAATTPDKRE